MQFDENQSLIFRQLTKNFLSFFLVQSSQEVGAVIARDAYDYSPGPVAYLNGFTELLI